MMFEQTYTVYEFGPFRLDAMDRTLLREGEPVPLTPKAFDILLLLIKNQRQPLSKDELMKSVWPDAFVEEINLIVQISALRRALGDTPDEHKYIATIPKVGYRFTSVVRELRSDPVDPGGRILSYAVPAKSIAVLPLKELGDNAERSHLGLGIADALITRLGSIRHVIVRPTAAVLKYRDLERDAYAVGREMGVDWLLDGAVQCEGEQIRLTVQLVNVHDEATLWADKYDGQLASIFGVQDAVCERVAQALSVQLSEDEQKELARNYTYSVDAYQLYVKGRYFQERRTEEGLNRSIECFGQAIAADDSYALALVGLSKSYALKGEYLYLHPKEAFPKAKEAALKALRIHPRLAEARSALGEVRMFHEWDCEGSESEFTHAVHLRPNDAQTRHNYAWLLLATERFNDAAVQIDLARELEPLSLTMNTAVGLPYFYMRRHIDAIAAYHNALDMDPKFTLARYYLAMALDQMGRYEEAVEEYDEIRRVEYVPQVLGHLGYTLAKWGKTDEALKVVAELKEMSRRRYISPYNLAMIYVGLGDSERSLGLLEEAFEGRAAWLVFLNVEPKFDALCAEPRFQRLAERIGFNAPAAASRRFR